MSASTVLLVSIILAVIALTTTDIALALQNYFGR